MRRSLPTAKLTAEWWDFQTSAPSMLILQFLTETLQVRTGVNTLVDTNHWNASGLDPLRTMANWSGGLTNHAIEFSKPRVRMHYTALCNVEMADNGVEPRTSTTLIMQTFPLPTAHVASLLVSSYVSAQLPTGEIGLHQLHWTCCVTEPIPLHIQLSSSFLFTCNWTSPKSDWAALVTLTKKGRKVSKTWWGEWIIGWRKLEHFTALSHIRLMFKWDRRHS